ncbi:MAG: hybrid sensor histidine kinase/response regulator [Gemmatimonadales bacterium]
MKDDSKASLESVIATGELAGRAARRADHQREHAAVLQLAEEMGHPSRHTLQRAAEIALECCGAGSAGVSIVEHRDGRERYRWQAVAGLVRDELWSLPALEESPTSVSVARESVQLFVRPDRYFRPLAALRPPILELLVAPFAVDGKLGGSVWVASHEQDRKFDSLDVRLLTDVSQMTAAAYHGYCIVERLRDANRHKDEFLAMLSHELRNPLAAMSNAVKFLTQRATVDEDQLRARGVVQRQLAQVVRLSDDLLDVARIGQGTLELRPDQMDLVAAVRVGREAAAPALGEYDREISVMLPDSPVWVQGDATRLAQVITNLLTNAARRTRSGGRVSLSLAESAGEAVIRVVSETDGAAAGWDHPSRMHGAAPSEPRPGEAQGIGLTLAKSLTEMHDGHVAAVDVDPGHENGFEVRLPLLKTAEGGPRIVRERRSDRPPARERQRRERILIIDDSVDASDSLAMLLREWGHEVRTAQGATAGLRLEWEFTPHAVILDIEMPGKNGYEVAAELRVRRRRDLLLVALSGHAREEDRTRSLEAGFDHHLTKPANTDMLRRLLS